jgi:hypothetical protein
MLRANVLSLVVALLFAGCSSSAGGRDEDDADANFDDIDIEVTDSTGVILGIVVDDRIVPVVGADVRLTIPGLEPLATTSDAQGRFVFQDLPAGTYFIQASHTLHQATQTTAEVVAGVEDPPLTRVQLVRLFTEEPYSSQIVKEGFFECTMAGPGPWYGSAMCVDYLLGPTITNAYPPLRNLTQQAREWHADVGSGWQSIVFDMTWEPSAQGTSGQMGMVVSTYKPTRDGSHQFAHVQSANPLWIRLDTGVAHPTAQGDPQIVPPEGMENMSYFVGVRGSPAAVALNQDFKVFLHIFYYGVLEKEDWSFARGDQPPF